MQPGRRWTALLLALGLAGATAVTGVAGAEPDVAPFVASASAAGVRVGYNVAGFVVVEEFADAGGPVAQTRLDTASGDSYAALPYPGGTVLAYQGLAALAGVNSPFAYPFFVSATHPATPEESLSDPSGAYQLEAKAQAVSAEATAAASGGSGDVAVSTARSDTSTVRAGRKVTAQASTVTEGLQVGAALRIASVRSGSVAVQVAGAGEPKTETELVIDGLRINDQPFGFGPGGFTIAGTPVPVPPEEANKVANEMLAPTGIRLRFLEAAPISGGAVAPVLEISAPHQLPLPGEPVGTLVVRIGGATASVTNTDATPLPVAETVTEPSPPATTPEVSPPPVADPAPGPAPVMASTSAEPAAPVASPVPPALPSPPPLSTGMPSPADLSAAPAPPGAVSANATPRPGVVIRASRVGGISAAYGAFLVAVVAALAGALAWFRGEMKAWLAS